MAYHLHVNGERQHVIIGPFSNLPKLYIEGDYAISPRSFDSLPEQFMNTDALVRCGRRKVSAAAVSLAASYGRGFARHHKVHALEDAIRAVDIDAEIGRIQSLPEQLLIITPYLLSWMGEYCKRDQTLDTGRWQGLHGNNATYINAQFFSKHGVHWNDLHNPYRALARTLLHELRHACEELDKRLIEHVAPRRFPRLHTGELVALRCMREHPEFMAQAEKFSHWLISITGSGSDICTLTFDPCTFTARSDPTYHRARTMRAYR